MIKQIYRSVSIASVCFFLLGLGAANAQTRVLTGKVVDNAGQGIPGANVVRKGTTTGTSTDIEGAFTLEANTDDILIISFIGYISEEIKVENQTSINVTLVEDLATLQEIVVVGYGSEKTRNLSSSQTNIGEDEIKKTVNTTLDQALQGRAPNVYVASNSGKPGGAASVYIRGVSSINGNTQPMYVIDGVQIIPPATTDSDVSSDGPSNILASINPDDIESMNVLSGPSAQSIYGSKASNGVIVVTTKKGKSGTTKINFSSQYNLQTLPKQLPTMNLREYAIYSNAWADVSKYGWQKDFEDPSILGEGTNWQTALFKTAAMTKQQLSISGGNEKTTYYLSGELMKQDGLAPNSGFTRKSIRLNIDNQVRSYLKIGTNVSLAGTSEKLSINSDNIISIAIQQAPSTPLHNSDGTWGGPQNITPTSPSYQALTNPVALAYTNSNVFNRFTTFGTVYGEIIPVKDFLFHAEFNGTYGNDTRAVFNPSYQFGSNALTVGYSNPVTNSSRNAGNNYTWQAHQRLTYAKKINNHDITVTVGHEAQKTFSENLYAAVSGYSNNNIPELTGGSTMKSITSSRDASSQESFFGRVGYIFNDKYIVQASYRADASSNFGPNNKWGYFPSASVAWRVSGESFMQNATWIDNLKLRVEMGTTGNQYYGKPIYATLDPLPTQNGQGFLALNFANPNLKWESTTSYNAGLDFSAFNNRVSFVFDAYLRKTDNLITDLPLPAYAGTTGDGKIGAPFVNLGNLENKGLGLSVNLVPIHSSGGLVWKTGFNISVDRNKLLKLNTDRAFASRQPWFTDVISRSDIGQPLWQFYSYEYAGIFKTYAEVANSAIPTGLNVNPQGVWVGDVKFKDINNDGKIDDQDRARIGNPWPKFTFGITNNFAYRNFDLSVFLQGVYGNQIFNQLRLNNSGFSNLIRGAYKEAITFARPSSYVAGDETTVLLNPTTNVPRVGNTPNANNRATDKFIEDGSYMRVKNITLTYTIPTSLVKKYLPMDGIKLTAGVQNAYTWTHYSGYDPEVGNAATVPGFDNGRYPSSRMYTFKLTADF